LLAITATPLTPDMVQVHDIECDAVDYASITAAERRGLERFDGCNMPPSFSVAIRPAEDMIIPHNLCTIHFNALVMSIQSGKIAVDGNFGNFPEE
jgi:hypothetical protein